MPVNTTLLGACQLSKANAFEYTVYARKQYKNFNMYIMK